MNSLRTVALSLFAASALMAHTTQAATVHRYQAWADQVGWVITYNDHILSAERGKEPASDLRLCMMFGKVEVALSEVSRATFVAYDKANVELMIEILVGRANAARFNEILGDRQSATDAFLAKIAALDVKDQKAELTEVLKLNDNSAYAFKALAKGMEPYNMLRDQAEALAKIRDQIRNSACANQSKAAAQQGATGLKPDERKALIELSSELETKAGDVRNFRSQSKGRGSNGRALETCDGPSRNKA
jgi:hypothetical protein